MIGIALFGGLLIFIILTLLIAYSQHSRTQVSRRMHDYLTDNINAGNYHSRKNITWNNRFWSLVHETAKLFKRLRQSQDFDSKMQQAGLPLLGSEFMSVILIISVTAGILVFLLLLRWQMALLTVIAMPMLCLIYINILIKRRRQAFTNQLGDTLSMVADAMRSGFSFIQSVEFVSKEMGAPIGEEFARMMTEIHIGTPMEQALQGIARRIDSRDFDLIVAAVLIQRQVGGNLAYILDMISGTINARIRMKREIKTLTAQGRLSGWVIAALPFVLAAVLYTVNPTYLSSLINNQIGRIAVGGAICLEIIGFIIIQRIVDIDV